MTRGRRCQHRCDTFFILFSSSNPQNLRPPRQRQIPLHRSLWTDSEVNSCQKNQVFVFIRSKLSTLPAPLGMSCFQTKPGHFDRRKGRYSKHPFDTNTIWAKHAIWRWSQAIEVQVWSMRHSDVTWVQRLRKGDNAFERVQRAERSVA